MDFISTIGAISLEKSGDCIAISQDGLGDETDIVYIPLRLLDQFISSLREVAREDQ